MKYPPSTRESGPLDRTMCELSRCTLSLFQKNDKTTFREAENGHTVVHRGVHILARCYAVRSGVSLLDVTPIDVQRGGGRIMMNHDVVEIGDVLLPRLVVVQGVSHQGVVFVEHVSFVVVLFILIVNGRFIFILKDFVWSVDLRVIDFHSCVVYDSERGLGNERKEMMRKGLFSNGKCM